MERRRWTRLINEGGVARSFGLGLFLSDFSLKNLALVAAAAGVIGQAAWRIATWPWRLASLW